MTDETLYGPSGSITQCTDSVSFDLFSDFLGMVSAIVMVMVMVMEMMPPLKRLTWSISISATLASPVFILVIIL